MTTDQEFVSYTPPEPDVVKCFLLTGSGGPSNTCPWIDMGGSIGSAWNSEVIALLVAKVMSKERAKTLDLPKYIWEEGVRRKVRAIQRIWKTAQPRLDVETGHKETEQEVDKRLAQSRAGELLRHRQRGRRISVCSRGITDATGVLI